MAKLCKNCGKNFEGGGKNQRNCSVECDAISAAKIRRCEPEYDESTLFVREVHFKNGTNHLQRACEKCRVTTFLPKSWGVAAGVIARPKRDWSKFFGPPKVQTSSFGPRGQHLKRRTKGY